MKKLILLAMMVVIIASCSEGSKTIDLIIENQVEYTADEKNDLICSYAQILAASLQDSELRSIIKTEAQLKFDGDYDILVSKLNNIKLPINNMTVEHILANSSITTKSNEGGFEKSHEELIAEIQKAIPNLQVAVPVHCDEWDTENYTPLVAYLPYDYIDQITTEVEAFDMLGNSYILSTKEEPEMPVIVVSISERIDEKGGLRYDKDLEQEIDIMERDPKTKASSDPTNLNVDFGGSCGLELSWSNVSNNNGYEIYRRKSTDNAYTKIHQTQKNVNTYTDVNLTSGTKYYYKVRTVLSSGYSGYSNIASKFASQRTDGAVSNVTQMRFTSRADLRRVEDWVSGAPEITLRVYSGAGSLLNIHITKEPPTRDDILVLTDDGENDWWEHTLNGVNNWSTDMIGYVLTYDWREEDYNRKETITITPYVYDIESDSLEPSNVTITIPEDHGVDHIGTKIMYFWDPKTTIYETNGFQWMCD